LNLRNGTGEIVYSLPSGIRVVASAPFYDHYVVYMFQGDPSSRDLAEHWLVSVLRDQTALVSCLIERCEDPNPSFQIER
jgi:hypothetical protein